MKRKSLNFTEKSQKAENESDIQGKNLDYSKSQGKSQNFGGRKS